MTNIAPLVLIIQGDSKVNVHVNKPQMLEVLPPFKFLCRRQRAVWTHKHYAKVFSLEARVFLLEGTHVS
jgi:hypothetical protein